MVQCLGLSSFTVTGLSSTPGLGTKIPQASGNRQKKKKKKKRRFYNNHYFEFIVIDL